MCYLDSQITIVHNAVIPLPQYVCNLSSQIQPMHSAAILQPQYMCMCVPWQAGPFNAQCSDTAAIVCVDVCYLGSQVHVMHKGQPPDPLPQAP